MALASYSDLQTEVANFLARADLTSEIPTLILLGEKRIQREVRTGDMETSYSGTIASGVIAVPTDFLEWKVVYIGDSVATKLQMKSLDWLLEKYPTRSASGLPKFIARSATNFEFGPYPDSDYSVKGVYYKRLTSVASSWNALATANPDIYLYGALAAAALYLKDDSRVAVWEAAYSATRDGLNAEAKEQDISGVLRVSL